MLLQTGREQDSHQVIITVSKVIFSLYMCSNMHTMTKKKKKKKNKAETHYDSTPLSYAAWSSCKAVFRAVRQVSTPWLCLTTQTAGRGPEPHYQATEWEEGQWFNMGHSKD